MKLNIPKSEVNKREQPHAHSALVARELPETVGETVSTQVSGLLPETCAAPLLSVAAPDWQTGSWSQQVGFPTGK